MIIYPWAQSACTLTFSLFFRLENTSYTFSAFMNLFLGAFLPRIVFSNILLGEWQGMVATVFMYILSLFPSFSIAFGIYGVNMYADFLPC